MTEATATPTERWDALMAIAIGCTFGNLSFLALPMWLGPAVERFHLETSASGWLASLELGAVTLLCLLFSSRVDAMPLRGPAILALFLSLLGNLLSILAPGLFLFIAARILVGLGAGALMALLFGAAARTSEPQRTFSMVTFSLTALFLVIMVGGPIAVRAYGLNGILGMLACIQLLGLFLFWRLPQMPAPATGNRGRFPRNWLVIGALGALVLLQSGNALIWAFTERIGRATGLSLDAVGQVLALSSVVSMAGPIIARIIGSRWGKTLPLVFALAMISVSVLFITHSAMPQIYSSASVVLPLFVMLGNPFIMGVLAGLDERGRVAAAAPAFSNIGSALGPFLGSLVLVDQDFALLGNTALVLYLAAIVLLVIPARRQDLTAHVALEVSDQHHASHTGGGP